MSTADCKTNKSIVDKIKSATPLEFLSTLFLVVTYQQIRNVNYVRNWLRIEKTTSIYRPMYTYNAHQHTAYFSTRTFLQRRQPMLSSTVLIL